MPKSPKYHASIFGHNFSHSANPQRRSQVTDHLKVYTHPYEEHIQNWGNRELLLDSVRKSYDSACAWDHI
jgi:hypothetical protein